VTEREPPESERPDLHPLTWVELLLWLVRRRRRVRVVGRSMVPTLAPGDEVLVDPNAYRHGPPARGDLVVLAHPQDSRTTLVKRVASVGGDGRCRVVGDNPPESTDSRHFGLVPYGDLQGRVACRFSG
jgi:nickel-type superoxide dismutase maturation protease